ncbi:histidine--tRNA ligase, partial [Candidatus Saccharibacteria bacterium]|nr:histidine--tRNA ligase [Candidatus Saccharibacteria bacterium]
SGMQELLPEQQAIFNTLKNKIAEVYHSHGYLDIETPAIERTEILLAKAGGDTEKQIYRVIKTAESADSSDQALRFDHTVPLARYIVEHESSLPFPFKVSQISPNYRGERAQKGRFREFYQCDIDVIGRNTLSIAYDADVIATLLHTYISFNLNTPIVARISNRKILTGLIETLNLTDKSTDIYSIIDHAEKVSPEKTVANLTEIGLSEESRQTILNFINLHGERSHVIDSLKAFNLSNPTFLEGVAELDKVLLLLESMNLADYIVADMKIVRGLDYYTGTVFEFILPDYKSIGSIGGGGRYDNLAKHFTEQTFPGVGGSIGLTRLFYILNEYHLLPSESTKPIDYAIIPISDAELDFAFSTAAKLRANGHTVTVVLTDKKLGDKLTYAAKVAAQGIVVGESEAASESLQVKDFTTGDTTDLFINNA